MRLNTHEWGDPQGRPLVCLHGVTGHGRRYRELASRLPTRRVLAVDLRGHGRSTWEPPWGVEQHVTDLIDTVDALGAGADVDWLGHSFGGLLVAELAARRPDRVARAVLLDPALHVDPMVAAERADLTRADVSFASADDAIEARLADGSLFTTPRSILEREMEEHLEPGEDGRLRARYSPAAAITAWSEMARPAPPWPTCPTLVVVGERSWIPVERPSLPHVSVVAVPGGHGVLWDDFDATADAIGSFLGAPPG